MLNCPLESCFCKQAFFRTTYAVLKEKGFRLPVSLLTPYKPSDQVAVCRSLSQSKTFKVTIS